MKRMQVLMLGLVLAGGCAGIDRDGSASEQERLVKVEKICFLGWTNSWKISNRECDLIVVPAINHVMSFALKGGSNLLWVAPDVKGPMIQEPGEKWRNFGGDKVWPTDEALWRRYMGRRWPPSYAFDGGQAFVEPLLNGVRMTSSEDPDFGAVCVREFVMDPEQPLVHIRQYYDKKQGAAVDMTLWTVTQVRQPAFCLLPLGREENGQRYRKLGGLQGDAFSTHGSVLSLKNDPGVCQKVGVAPDPSYPAGWVAALYKKEKVVFLQSHQLEVGAIYPDQGCDAEIFAGNNLLGLYCEMELLGPMVTLSVGQRHCHDIVWQIVRVNSEEVRDPGQTGKRIFQAHEMALKRLSVVDSRAFHVSKPDKSNR